MRRRAKALAAACLVAALASPDIANACSRCNFTANGPECERANYVMCNVPINAPSYCQEMSSNCAWVQNAAEVSADGSLRLQSAPVDEAELAAGELVRGCNGLVAARAYSDAHTAELRAESAVLRI